MKPVGSRPQPAALLGLARAPVSPRAPALGPALALALGTTPTTGPALVVARGTAATTRTALVLGTALPLGTGLALALALGVADAAAQSPASAPATIYTCSDAAGRVISSDRPIPACEHRSMRELNADGSLRRLIAPPLTKEQEKEQASQERQREEELLARRIQQSRDRNLLLTFEDERALESMRRRGLADIDRDILTATRRILSLDKELKLAQAAAASWRAENPRKQLPITAQQQIMDAANSILAEDSVVSERQSERDRVNSRFDADATRLRQLLGTAQSGEGARSAAR